MSFLDTLERKFPKLAIPGLLRHVCLLMLVTYGLDMTRTVYLETWVLRGTAVFSGQIWRLVTFLFVPISTSPIFLLFELMILVLIADGLESAWGSFRLTVYYLTGALGAIMVAFILPGGVITSGFLNLSLFLAFATIYPDYEILIFFVIPVKVKYLGIISGFFVFWTIATAPLILKIVAVLSIINYFLFFGGAAFRAVQQGATNYNRRREYEDRIRRNDGPRHTCCFCGRTDFSDPNLEFRYCTCPKCGKDGQAFCIDHLGIHKGTSI